MRVLITGITGLLGRYLVEDADSQVELHGVSRGSWPRWLTKKCQMHQMDVTSHADLARLIGELTPDVTIHTAAEGRVDLVEADPSRHRTLNVLASEHLASLAREHGGRFVFVSSNAVFGGGPVPYRDNSPFDPVNQYGVLKVEAEKAVSKINPDSLIVRPLLMYGWPMEGQRKNPVVSWIDRLRNNERILVVDDVWSEPLAAWDCARAIWTGLKLEARGSVNVSGGNRVSLYEFALLTSEVFGLDSSLVYPVSSDSFPYIAPRPHDTTYDLARLRNELGIWPCSPLQGLQRMKETESLVEKT